MNYNTRKTKTVLKGVKYGELTTVRRTDKRKKRKGFIGMRMFLWQSALSRSK